MRKISVLLIVMIISISSFAQSKPESLKPYASGGISMSTGIPTYGLETGLYNHKYWIGIVGELTKIPYSSKIQVYVGPKFYKTLFDVSPESQFFAYGAIKMNTGSQRDFVFEPGFCYVYNIGEKFAIQISVSSPINEGQQIGNPTNLSAGLSLNYWIR